MLISPTFFCRNLGHKNGGDDHNDVRRMAQSQSQQQQQFAQKQKFHTKTRTATRKNDGKQQTQTTTNTLRNRQFIHLESSHSRGSTPFSSSSSALLTNRTRISFSSLTTKFANALTAKQFFTTTETVTIRTTTSTSEFATETVTVTSANGAFRSHYILPFIPIFLHIFPILFMKILNFMSNI